MELTGDRVGGAWLLIHRLWAPKPEKKYQPSINHYKRQTDGGGRLKQQLSCGTNKFNRILSP